MTKLYNNKRNMTFKGVAYNWLLLLSKSMKSKHLLNWVNKFPTKLPTIINAPEKSQNDKYNRRGLPNSHTPGNTKCNWRDHPLQFNSVLPHFRELFTCAATAKTNCSLSPSWCNEALGMCHAALALITGFVWLPSPVTHSR